MKMLSHPNINNQLVTFSLADLLFGIPLVYVEEVCCINNSDILKVPGSKNYVKGIVVKNDIPYYLYDIGGRFSLYQVTAERKKLTSILLVRTIFPEKALLADNILGNVTFRFQDIKKTEKLRIPSVFLKGTIEGTKAQINILNIEKLFKPLKGS